MEKKKILIVEDEGVLALRIKGDLEEMGYYVVGIYASGEEALKGIMETSPDLVLMDINIQGNMDGIDTAGRIKENYDVPVIYLTAHSEGNIIERAKITEPYGYILKPFNAKDLRIMVEVALYKHKIDREKALLAKELSITNEALFLAMKEWELTFDSLTDMLMIIDMDFKIIKTNKAFLEKLGKTSSEVLGKKCFRLLHNSEAPPPTCVHKKMLSSGEGEMGEVQIDDRLYSVTVSPIYDSNGQLKGVVHAARDITERKRMEAEREKLILELQEAMANVKQLSGLLPICASCKKIRDDKGYWNQIETYISEHSEALFSHAICPDCGKKLYPEYYDELWGKDEDLGYNE